MQILIKGELTDIFPAEVIGSFEKRVAWVLEKDVQYPNHYQLEFHQGDANLLDRFVPGDIVECKVDVRGKKFTARQTGKVGVINTLKCWSILKVGDQKPTPSTRQQTGGIPPKNTPTPSAGNDQWKAADTNPGDDDDLPF